LADASEAIAITAATTMIVSRQAFHAWCWRLRCM
jgi:hypothetical protein